MKTGHVHALAGTKYAAKKATQTEVQYPQLISSPILARSLAQKPLGSGFRENQSRIGNPILESTINSVRASTAIMTAVQTKMNVKIIVLCSYIADFGKPTQILAYAIWRCIGELNA